MTAHTCPHCNGTRTYTVLVTETRTGISYPNGWPCDGGKPVEVAYETGRTVERLYVCDHCRGTGVIFCQSCDDTGWMPEFDYATGEYEGDRPCLHCAKGRVIEERERIDAEKAAFDGDKYERLANDHNERIAAGLEPY